MRSYWNLSETATFRDLILCIRADEAMHREVNKDFSVLSELGYTQENIYSKKH